MGKWNNEFYCIDKNKMLFANKVCVYYFMENKERHSDWKRAFELSEATVGGRSGCWVDDGQLRTILIFPITRVVPFYAIRVIKGSKRERVFNICFPKIFVLLSGGGLGTTGAIFDNNFLIPALFWLSVNPPTHTLTLIWSLTIAKRV